MPWYVDIVSQVAELLNFYFTDRKLSVEQFSKKIVQCKNLASKMQERNQADKMIIKNSIIIALVDNIIAICYPEYVDDVNVKSLIARHITLFMKGSENSKKLDELISGIIKEYKVRENNNSDIRNLWLMSAVDDVASCFYESICKAILDDKEINSYISSEDIRSKIIEFASIQPDVNEQSIITKSITEKFLDNVVEEYSQWFVKNHAYPDEINGKPFEEIIKKIIEHYFADQEIISQVEAQRRNQASGSLVVRNIRAYIQINSMFQRKFKEVLENKDNIELLMIFSSNKERIEHISKAMDYHEFLDERKLTDRLIYNLELAVSEAFSMPLHGDNAIYVEKIIKQISKEYQLSEISRRVISDVKNKETSGSEYLQSLMVSTKVDGYFIKFRDNALAVIENSAIHKVLKLNKRERNEVLRTINDDLDSLYDCKSYVANKIVDRFIEHFQDSHKFHKYRVRQFNQLKQLLKEKLENNNDLDSTIKEIIRSILPSGIRNADFLERAQLYNNLTSFSDQFAEHLCAKMDKTNANHLDEYESLSSIGKIVKSFTRLLKNSARKIKAFFNKEYDGAKFSEIVAMPDDEPPFAYSSTATTIEHGKLLIISQKKSQAALDDILRNTQWTEFVVKTVQSNIIPDFAGFGEQNCDVAATNNELAGCDSFVAKIAGGTAMIDPESDHCGGNPSGEGWYGRVVLGSENTTDSNEIVLM